MGSLVQRQDGAQCPLRWRTHHVGSVPAMCKPAKANVRVSPESWRIGEAGSAARGAGEQGALVVGRGAGDDALEGVPQCPVADRHLVDRKVALEHAALGTEQLDAGL